MSETTKNLKLFKYNTTSDANVPFSIDNALNANWDILDENWSKGAGVLPGFLYKVTGLIDESENIFRYANGQVITEDDSVSGLSTFLDKQEKLGADIFCTELEWQNIKTASKLGQVGKYVRDKKAGTIRLPLILNEQGLTDLANCGVVKNESLPNIKTTSTTMIASTNQTASFNLDGGCVKTKSMGTVSTGGGSGADAAMGIDFDASKSSSTYQDSAPVQQEAIQYPYVIVVNTGVEEAERPINNYQVNNVYSYGMSQYYKGTMNNSSWLRSAGQWNKGTVYTGIYNWILQQANNGVEWFKGTKGYAYTSDTVSTTWYVISTETPKIGQAVYGSSGIYLGDISSVADNKFTYTRKDTAVTDTFTRDSSRDITTDTWLTDYDFVVNTEEQTFRLPIKNGQEGVFADLTVPDGYNLYYYIGDTLQNTSLINIARIGEQLVDRTTTAQAAHAAMPSGKYVKVSSLGASGSKYTAPADGWFACNFGLKQTSASGVMWGKMVNVSTGYTGDLRFFTNTLEGEYMAMLPVKKGDVIAISYLAPSVYIASWEYGLRFVYAEGVKE